MLDATRLLDSLRTFCDSDYASFAGFDARQKWAAAAITDGVSVATRHAGLSYLAGRVLEIDLAEALWAAGVAEGDVLAHVARAILDDDDDPAWRWFGGAFDRAPPPPVIPGWALAEVDTSVQHALGRRLVRFDVVLTPAQLDAELARLAATINARAPGDPATARVIARCAAALACIVAARLGRPATWPLVREVAARPGQLVLTLRVVMPATAIDLDHRRAGLDQDPGRIPWLARRICLEYVGGDTL